MKINKLFKLILIMLMAICIVQFIPNKVEAAATPTLKVTYIYSSNKDRVTVQVKSNMKFKNTKPSWTLSKDKKTYSKKFYTNQTYKTKFTAQNGKTKTLTIKVSQIQGPKITVSYSYNKTKNTVKVTVKSNKEFKDTKPTWDLSKDKLTYTKTFKNNQTYTTAFYDKYGNKKNVKLTINQIDKTAPIMTLKYEYNEKTNIVKLTAKSNEELKDTKPTWTLSKDKLTYTKTFKNNQTYTTAFYDKYGNKKNVTIKITQIDDVGPKLSTTYKYSDDKNKVLVTLTANEKLSDSLASDGWELSNDKKIYTKTFNRNGTYSVILKDKWGNETKKTVKITGLIYRGIDVSSHNGKIDWAKVKLVGVDFVIIRCGYGKNITSQDDSTFRYNIEECERLSIPYGVYIYSYTLDVEGVKSEVEHVLRLIKGYAPQYGIWFDMEDADGYKKRNGMPTNETLVNICDTFCKEMKNAGYGKVGIYANSDWWNNRLNDSKLDIYDKWIAHWGNNDDIVENICKYNGKYDMWQYTSSGSVNGIIGNVDMNYCYKNY